MSAKTDSSGSDFQSPMTGASWFVQPVARNVFWSSASVLSTETDDCLKQEGLHVSTVESEPQQRDRCLSVALPSAFKLQCANMSDRITSSVFIFHSSISKASRFVQPVVKNVFCSSLKLLVFTMALPRSMYAKCVEVAPILSPRPVFTKRKGKTAKHFAILYCS